MEYSRVVDIQASPATVFAVWSDVDRWPEWTPSVSRVARLGAPSTGLSVGLRVRVTQPSFPAATWRVTSVDADRGFTWVSESPGARVTGSHRIEPVANGSRAIATIRFAGPIALLVGWISRSLTLRYLDMEASGLKRRCEERGAGRAAAGSGAA